MSPFLYHRFKTKQTKTPRNSPGRTLKKQEASIPVDSLCARMDSYHHFQPEGKSRKHVFGFSASLRRVGKQKRQCEQELSNIHAPKKTCELMCHTEVTPSICMLRGGTVVCKRQTISREGSRGKRQDFQWLQDACLSRHHSSVSNVEEVPGFQIYE